jgi:hypothetical protein
MTDFYLKTTDRETWDTAADAVGLTDCHIDHVGQIGDAPGYHVNIRTWNEPANDLVQQMTAHGVEILTPATPSRVWA